MSARTLALSVLPTPAGPSISSGFSSASMICSAVAKASSTMKARSRKRSRMVAASVMGLRRALSTRQLLAHVGKRLRDQLLRLGVEHAAADGGDRTPRDGLTTPLQNGRAVAGIH